MFSRLKSQLEIPALLVVIGLLGLSPFLSNSDNKQYIRIASLICVCGGGTWLFNAGLAWADFPSTLLIGGLNVAAGSWFFGSLNGLIFGGLLAVIGAILIRKPW